MADKQPAPLITPQMLRNWNACYAGDRIAELYGRRKALSPLEICELQIPPMDRLWVVLRAEIIPVAELHQLGLRLVDGVVQRSEWSARIRAVAEQLLETKRQWLAGAVDDVALQSARHQFRYTGYNANAIYYAASPYARDATYHASRSICARGVQTEDAYPLAACLDTVRNTLASLYTERKRRPGVKHAE